MSRDDAPAHRAAAPASPGRTYRALTGALLIALAAVGVVHLFTGDADQRLDALIRLHEPDLSGLPVQIANVESCNCWQGPRGQAERKFKFTLFNNSDVALNVGGGQRSSIRLLVAYPGRKRPRLIVPQSARDDQQVQLGSPSDITVAEATAVQRIRPGKLEVDGEPFAVPAGFTIWAIPPNPNKLAERRDPDAAYAGVDDSFTFPTVVDDERLWPGQRQETDRLGHGTWTFYVPLRARFRKRVLAGLEPILKERSHEDEVIFVGIAVLHRQGDATQMLGFAPAPSVDALGDPALL